MCVTIWGTILLEMCTLRLVVVHACAYYIYSLYGTVHTVYTQFMDTVYTVCLYVFVYIQ